MCSLPSIDENATSHLAERRELELELGLHSAAQSGKLRAHNTARRADP